MHERGSEDAVEHIEVGESNSRRIRATNIPISANLGQYTYNASSTIEILQ